MNIHKLCMVVLVLSGAVGCTSLSEGEGTLPPNPNQNRRVTYTGGERANLNRQLYERTSEINRKRNIEEFDRNGPATTPPTLRPRLLPDAPVDSTRHIMPLPARVRKPLN